MYKKIILSATSLLSVVALGIGATYALFTSNTATISANTLTTGLAEIKICNETADGTWGGTVSPGFTVTGLVPGASEQELTAGNQVWLGNDDGGLNTEIGGAICDSYGANTPGSSDVSMQMVPKLSSVSCDDASLLTDMQLRFQINGNDTGFGSITFWSTNTSPIAQTFTAGGAAQVKIYSKLATGATVQNKSCTFNIDFQGSQVI